MFPVIYIQLVWISGLLSTSIYIYVYIFSCGEGKEEKKKTLCVCSIMRAYFENGVFGLAMYI